MIDHNRPRWKFISIVAFCSNKAILLPHVYPESFLYLLYHTTFLMLCYQLWQPSLCIAMHYSFRNFPLDKTHQQQLLLIYYLNLCRYECNPVSPLSYSFKISYCYSYHALLSMLWGTNRDCSHTTSIYFPHSYSKPLDLSLKPEQFLIDAMQQIYSHQNLSCWLLL